LNEPPIADTKRDDFRFCVMRSVESGTFDQIFGSNNEKGEEEEYWNIEALYGPQTTVSPRISTMARRRRNAEGIAERHSKVRRFKS